MALFALYRMFPSEGQLRVFLSDIRPGRRSVQHHCVLPNQSWVIPDLTAELGCRGFMMEFERKSTEGAESRIFSVHRVPARDNVNSADAIYAVCTRHGITPRIVTHHGQLLTVPIRAAVVSGRPSDLKESHASTQAALHGRP